MKWAVVAFPGTNCEEDTRYVLANQFDQDVRVVWHHESELGPVDAVVLPGGFAHGDYLRSGAIARFSPIMDAVNNHVAKGKPVLGICNGMQVLTEAGLLPGAMLRNDSLEFRCQWVNLRVETRNNEFLGSTEPGTVLRIPISHGEGRYHCDAEDLRAMERGDQIMLRYCTAGGAVDETANPNGSIDNIAGIRNASGTVFGLMPHPERACDPLLGGKDGQLIFAAMIEAMHD
ncbi:MAG: phosphoribosylformylglycinamidine synthase subunit [Chloroflexi bacterium]|nr:phosphoribosylformylglycinamidine synthase subunit [Chloroflexota bacterium]